MSTVLHPVGPRPPQVYWVRRLVVLALLVGLVGAVAVLWGVLGRGAAPADGADGGSVDGTTTAAEGKAGTGTETGTETVGDPAAEAPATPTGPPVCAPADLTLVLATDARTYPAGMSPTFTVSLTNAGAVACTVDASAPQRELVVTSGSDRIWSSLDCPGDTTPNLLLLEPGARTDAAVPWGRTRSAAGCPADLPEPRPGTYSAVVTTLGATSAAAVFDLG